MIDEDSALTQCNVLHTSFCSCPNLRGTPLLFSGNKQCWCCLIVDWMKSQNLVPAGVAIPSSFGREYKGKLSLCMCAVRHTGFEDHDMDILNGWMPATEPCLACTIPEDGIWPPGRWLSGCTFKNLSSIETFRVLALDWRRWESSKVNSCWFPDKQSLRNVWKQPTVDASVGYSSLCGGKLFWMLPVVEG